MMYYEKEMKHGSYEDYGCNNNQKEYCYKKQYCKMEPVWYEKTCKCKVEKMDNCH